MGRGNTTRDKIMKFIGDFREREGYSPTVREIAKSCGVSSPSVVQYHLNRLVHNGSITKGKEKFRSIATRKERHTDEGLPLLGRIAAGQPMPVPTIEAIEAADRVAVPREITKGKRNLYALQVMGHSMIDAMIADGDIVVMEQALDVHSGDVVAVWLKNEQEVTLKKIYFEDERVRLQPCNPLMQPIYQSAENVEVQGRVVGVLRMLP